MRTPAFGVLFALALVGCAASVPPPAAPQVAFGKPGCVSPSARHYDVSLVLNPKARRLDARARITLSCLPEGALTFFLHESFFIERATIDGRAVLTRDGVGALESIDVAAPVALSYRGATRGEVTLEVAYYGKLRTTISDVNELSEDLVELAAYSAWYPILEGSRSFSAELQVSAPARYKVIARGARASGLSMRSPTSRSYEEMRDSVWRSRTNASDLVVLAAPHFRVLALGDAEKARVHYATLPRSLARRFAGTSTETLALFRSRFGTAPGSDTATLVFSPRAGWGYARSGFVVQSEERVRDAASDERAFRDAAHRTAHEIAHFWWNLADVQTQDDWINEALAEYSALRFSEAHFGVEEADRWEADYARHVRSSSAAHSLSETSATSPHRYVNWYERGALFFRAIERTVGTAAFDAFLGTLRRRSRVSALDTSSLRAWLKEAFGAEVEALVALWLDRVPLPAPDSSGEPDPIDQPEDGSGQ